MRHHIIAAAFLASLLIDAAAFAAPKTLENIPLKWTPTTTLAELGPVDLSGAMLTAKIHFESLVDTRQNPTLIAENREKPDKVRTVTTSSDVAGFVNEHLQASLRSAGLNIVEGPADIVVSGEIRQFFVTEVNTYNGGISLLLHIKNSVGKELWSGTVNGEAGHFGRSYRADNYYETFSDMVLSAAHTLLGTGGFRDAVLAH